MKKIVLLILVVGGGVLFYLNNSGDISKDYLKEIELDRAEKEDFMKTAASSPFVQSKESFRPLDYYPINPKFKVKATVSKIESLEYENITQSDGKSKQYVKYAILNFQIDNKPLELTVLKPAGFGQMDILFTAFADDTSGEDTYGGGRYLDLNFKNASTITLDFNKAYNPYCAYNEGFSCPLPPRENLLAIKILAGEKNFHTD